MGVSCLAAAADPAVGGNVGRGVICGVCRPGEAAIGIADGLAESYMVISLGAVNGDRDCGTCRRLPAVRGSEVLLVHISTANAMIKEIIPMIPNTFAGFSTSVLL
eukprot:CAMPEP_0172718850 /NCGR_PEP_ID=MMETSP1074-20121228/75164_1 /TAXON_ID=2916 /ORGANISM="Ceratium fusus, Strain PA161109" /LENGTH=104 /DNA_ID=CAMNT_0013544135 /DNA_START=441 /DNA_END=755 /DNA_ORIENTATION=-